MQFYPQSGLTERELGVRAQCVLQLCPTLWDPVTVALQASLSMGFSRLEYWSGLPSPGIEPTSALQANSLPLSHWASQENWEDHLIVQTLIILITLPFEWFLDISFLSA